ncbi:MAG: hypothetical protein WCC94_07290 [Candidatus Bathyarchaeia archaeon]
MRLVDRYVLFYALVIILSGLSLMVVGVREIEIYYAVYLIEFLVALELVASFRRSLGRNLLPIIIVFLFGFAYTVAQRIIQILS